VDRLREVWAVGHQRKGQARRGFGRDCAPTVSPAMIEQVKTAEPEA